MKLYFDEHLPTTLALMLQERGHDCLTTQAAGNVGRSDEDQLAYAAGERRVILTFNRNDFLLLAKEWFALVAFMQALFSQGSFQPHNCSVTFSISSRNIVKMFSITRSSGSRIIRTRLPYSLKREQPDYPFDSQLCDRRNLQGDAYEQDASISLHVPCGRTILVMSTGTGRLNHEVQTGVGAEGYIE